MLNTLALRLEKLPFDQTGNFSQGFLDYIAADPKLEEFYEVSPKLENFKSVIENRKFPKEQRETLVKVINQQYDGLVLSGKMLKNLARLKNSTCFSITTGHQLNIFTGPLYFIYKIVSTINTCRALKEAYPDYDFVPVYWMASEDHDFAEINHFHLFGQTHNWETSQEGAVGRFSTQGMTQILDELKECPELFREAYGQDRSLADATRYLVNELFGDHGLIVVDADHSDLKRQFIPIIRDELVHHYAYAAVSESSEKMRGKGYKTLVTPREINLFYLTNETRQRIVKKDGRYEVLGTDISFSAKEIKSLLEKHPECFSPNVVLRTVYQETVLPNIAYVGGPGELSYWLQFKSTFDHYQVPFPVLLPRNCALIINKGQMKKFQKLQLQLADLFLRAPELKKKFINRNSEQLLDLDAERAILKELFERILDKAQKVDGSLPGYVRSEESKTRKNLDLIEKRIKKAEEQKQEVSINQLMALKDKLFPDGGLQERYDNLLNYYLNNTHFIDELVELLDPFDLKFHIIMEDG
ncbi:MAG: bacillithiol biosynthesis cysteine-adding enzyme BshC [Cyclobacteriaceae bacterium]|nr:bacillithiol biosynthesis cysteine-adding enzyme BshC [Cyclobacteriaceae bacterium]